MQDIDKVLKTLTRKVKCLECKTDVGFNNPMTDIGDIIIGGIDGQASRLPIGSNNQVLQVVGGVPTWQTLSGGGGGTYTFSTGLTEISGTVTNDLHTGKAGGQTIYGDTQPFGNLTIKSNTDIPEYAGIVYFGDTSYINQTITRTSLVIGSLDTNLVSSKVFLGVDMPVSSPNTIFSSSIINPADINAIYAQTSNRNNVYSGYFVRSAASAATLSLSKARGTYDVPSILSANDAVGSILFRAHSGTSLLGTINILSRIDATATLSSTSMPTNLEIRTGSNSTPTAAITISYNQNVTIGSTTNTTQSVALMVDSTTKTFRPPVMTTAQKTAVTSPVEGSVVYDSTLKKLSVFTGTVWETVTSS